MADGAAGCEAQHVAGDGGVAAEEGECGGEFVCFCSGEEGWEERLWDERGQEEVARHEERAEEVENDHHLGTGGLSIAVWRGEDVVLHGVGQAVEEEVDGEERQAVDTDGGLRLTGGFAGLGRVVKREEGDAARHGEDDQVL